jgi:hypothetical protein
MNKREGIEEGQATWRAFAFTSQAGQVSISQSQRSDLLSITVKSERRSYNESTKSEVNLSGTNE